ncbi:MAG TPA: ATP synthase F1 subunit gamma [Spirochaetia bacterium]
MAKTREIRKRIQSVRNIHKITATMEKVAQSKGMKLGGRIVAATSFRDHLLRLLPEALGAPLGGIDATDALRARPLGEQRGKVKSVLVVGLTSSRGLCGGYNARVIQATKARVEELRAAGTGVMLAIIGRKGLAYFRYHNEEVALPVADVDENVPFSRVDAIVGDIVERFTSGKVDAVEIVSTRYRSKVAQDVRRVPFLPFTGTVVAAAPREPSRAPDGSPLYLVEPDRERVLSALLPLIVKQEMLCTMLEAMLCEQAQRSIAMRSASDNADSMTKRLTRTYNRARQAQITNEMIEIISGSEGGRT